MAATSSPIEIFCSYAHEDEAWLRKLETHLSLLKRQGLISLWHDRLITPGTNWATAIDIHLETASVILLLVSADFLASDYCYSVEMKRALERDAAGEARVIPILVRPADWKGAPFAHLQALPTNAKPVASWRSQDQALTAIAADLRRVIEYIPPLVASAPRAALPTIWNIPYPRNPFFTGREELLEQLSTALRSGSATALTQPQGISGLGGIGKTQLALEYAYRFQTDYEAVFWMRADRRENLISDFVGIARLLKLPEQDAQDQLLSVKGVQEWLRKHGKWLLILDNADSLHLVREFLPPAYGGHLLLTTRAQTMGRLAHSLPIEKLEPLIGALFVLQRAGILPLGASLEQASSNDRKAALHIVREMDGLPLALDQAGAYMEEAPCSVEDYLQLYRRQRASLLKRRGGVVADHPASVAATWSLAFDQVEQENPAAADLLRMCAFCHPDAIPEELLTAGASHLGPVLQAAVIDEVAFNDAIGALRAYSLIQREVHEKSLSLHRLVQAVLKDAMNKGVHALWAERTVRAVAKALPPVDIELRPQWERFLPHALMCAKLIEQQKMSFPEALELLQFAGNILSQLARYAEAALLLQRALAISEQQLGPEDASTADCLNNLAGLYIRYGKFAEAEPLLQRALTISEQQIGAEDPGTAVILNNLAWLYERRKRYAEAELLLQRALAILEQQFGPEHLLIAHSLNILAWVYETQGKNTEVEPLRLRVLAIRELQLGAEHPLTADGLHNLADFYSRQEKYAEAESLYQRVLAIREQKLGPEHPDTATSLTHLAFLYVKQEKHEEAEALYHRALRIREQQFGPEHFEVAVSLNYLAWLYRQQGKYAEAEPLFQRALHIREKALGPQHPETVESTHNLASLREKQGNSEEARALYARALAAREQALGAHHPKTIEARTHLIVLLHTLGQHEEAAKLETTQADS